MNKTIIVTFLISTALTVILFYLGQKQMSNKAGTGNNEEGEEKTSNQITGLQIIDGIKKLFNGDSEDTSEDSNEDTDDDETDVSDEPYA